MAFQVSKGWAEIWGLVAVPKVPFCETDFFPLRTGAAGGGGGRPGGVRDAKDLLGQDAAFLSELHPREPSVREGVGSRVILPALY